MFIVHVVTENLLLVIGNLRFYHQRVDCGFLWVGREIILDASAVRILAGPALLDLRESVFGHLGQRSSIVILILVHIWCFGRSSIVHGSSLRRSICS